MFDLDSALGIEMMDDRLALAAVSRRFGSFVLKSHRIIEGVGQLEKADLQQRIQSYLRENSFNRENVVLGLPRDHVVAHNVELPLDVEENLAEVVRFQVSRLQPSEDNIPYYDYLVLDRDEKAKTLRLQIFMIPREELDAMLSFFGEMNLYPAAIRVTSFGLHQILRAHKDGPKTTALILRINESSLETVAVTSPSQCFSARSRGPSKGPAPDWVLAQADELLSELRLRDYSFDRLYVCGSLDKSLLEPLKNTVGEAYRLVDGVSLSSNGGPLQSELLPAAGLAISGLVKSAFGRFNFIPKEKRVTGQRPSLIPTVVLAVVLLSVVVALATREYYQQRQLLAAVSTEVERLKPQVDRALAMRQQVQQELETLKEVEQVMQGRDLVLDVLRELTERIPEDTYLQSLNIRNTQVSLTGLSDSASSLINVLSGSQLLTNVESRYITRDQASGKDKFNFEARIGEDEGDEP